MNRNHKFDRMLRRQSGFSLLEVLITIVILAIGLLGLAAMQARGLSNNHSAYQRSQAAVLAYDMADRMRANMGAILNYTSSTRLPATANPRAVCRTTGVCSTDELAEDDLYEWYTAMQSALPGATGTIVDEGLGLYSVTVTWTEANRDDDRNETVDTGSTTFKVSFIP